MKVLVENMTVGDLLLLEKMQKSEASMTEMVAYLDRMVEGGVQHLPVTQLGDIMEQVSKAVQSATSTEKGTPLGN